MVSGSIRRQQRNTLTHLKERPDRSGDATAADDRGDYSTAARLWRELAEHGDYYAQYRLGVMYGRGRGVPQDYAETVKWYRLTAEQGFEIAQYELGLMYNHGEGVPQDYAEAVKWYRLAAERGFPLGQIGLHYADNLGHGVSQDCFVSEKWIKLAVQNDRYMSSGETEHILGNFYDLGCPFNENRDLVEAVKWYRLASEQGNKHSQWVLANKYKEGMGILQDHISAHMWFNIASANGYLDGAFDRNEIEKKMSPSDISEARRRAKVCMNSNYQDCD